MRTLRLALAQINLKVGDFHGNLEKISRYIGLAEAEGADIVAFPEMCITGYPPEDLLLKPHFIKDNIRALNEIRKKTTSSLVVVIGFVDMRDDIYNAAALLYDGKLIDVYHKIFLPNYGVFDEMRYFQCGTTLPVYEICGVNVGVNICEDIWYADGPIYKQSLGGAEVIININASPYSIHKSEFRQRMLSTRASDNSVILAYLNTVGGQDELVFDGQSLIYAPDGSLIARGITFAEELIVADLDVESVFMARLKDPRRRQSVRNVKDGDIRRIHVHNSHRTARKSLKSVIHPAIGHDEEVYTALVTGTRDYVLKNGFTSVIIGLSGGIDSAIVATIAVDAIGKENVMGVFMPSPFTSDESREDVAALAQNLGITVTEVSITNIFESYLDQLRPQFKGRAEDTTEENLQARIRGNILMAFSNKFGSLVLTTGNKSEMSVGYATLYGDMAGGFAVIKDTPKTLVYAIARWRNAKEPSPLIPPRILTKEPTAELRHNQKDTDSLPPYDRLDPLIDDYVEREMSYDEILLTGVDSDTTRKVLRMIDTNEYKRRQAPPGVKITGRAFGKDRRMPITNGYRGY